MCVCCAVLRGLSTIACASSSGKEPDSVDDGVKSVERLLEQKRRADLSARIASGDFTVEQSGYAFKNLELFHNAFDFRTVVTLVICILLNAAKIHLDMFKFT